MKLDALWYFHVTVETDAHCLDALTGVGGTPRASYLDEHWTHSDAILWTEEDAT